MGLSEQENDISKHVDEVVAAIDGGKVDKMPALPSAHCPG